MCAYDEKWKFCEKCGCKKIVKETEPLCPKCSGLDIVTPDKAVNIYEQLHSWFNSQLATMIEVLDKTELIFWLLEERTILASYFMHKSPSFNLSHLFALNDLLKKAFRVYNIKGSEKTDYEKAIQLIENYSSVIEEVAIKRYLVEEGYAHCILKKPIDLQNIKQSELFPNDLISSFSYYVDVDWINLHKSLELNMILSNEATEKYFSEHKEEYEEINNNTREKVAYTPEQTIKNLYPALKSLRDSLTMSPLFTELYDIRYLKYKKIPVEVFSTIADCPTIQLGILRYISKTEFIKYIAEKIKDFSPEEIYNNLVFNENNQGIFPFMVEINEKIYISPNFIDLMKLYYIPIYYQDTLFKAETERRSDLFEKVEIPNKLKENGFKVKSDIKDRDKKNELQIDSIARKGNKVYVIETKLWDIGLLFMRKKTHLQRERDLKGIVDGFEYTTKSGILVKKKKPSLHMKIDYVKENLKNWSPDCEKITTVEGLIITRSYPPITEYKGVKIVSLEEINIL